MAKLFSLSHIIMPDGTEIPRRTVFDATPAQAKQFDALKAARPATEAEVNDLREREELEAAAALPDAVVVRDQAPVVSAEVEKAPESIAPADPQGKPKSGKN